MLSYCDQTVWIIPPKIPFYFFFLPPTICRVLKGSIYVSGRKKKYCNVTLSGLKYLKKYIRLVMNKTKYKGILLSHFMGTLRSFHDWRTNRNDKISCDRKIWIWTGNYCQNSRKKNFKKYPYDQYRPLCNANILNPAIYFAGICDNESKSCKVMW